MPARRTLALLVLFASSLLAVQPARAGVYVYSAILDARQEVPANGSTGQGAGRFIIDTDANTVTYRIVYAGLTGAPNAGHIHGSASLSLGGGTAGVVHTFTALTNPITGVWTYTEAQEPMILAGHCYANIHTAANPAGEIRGEIVSHNAQLDAGQETPTNASAGSGWVVGVVDTVAKTLTYYGAYSGLTGAATAGHFHGNALHGSNAGVKITIASAATSPFAGVATYLPADQDALLSGRWYVNLHTAANLGGEIRGQFVPTVIPIDATQEVPATAAPNSAGFAMVAVDSAAHTLSYDERVLALAGTETAAHIHGFGGPTLNAGVLNPQSLGTRKLGVWAFGAANDANVFGGLTYFNVHSNLFGGGEIRGQLENLPRQVTIVQAGVGDGPRLTSGLLAAPNPFGSRTVLSFHLARTGSVSLAIVGVDGRSVRKVPAALYAPGAHSLEWDGRDDAGVAAAPGVYFAVVRTPDGQRITRIARLR